MCAISSIRVFYICILIAIDVNLQIVYSGLKFLNYEKT